MSKRSSNFSTNSFYLFLCDSVWRPLCFNIALQTKFSLYYTVLWVSGRNSCFFLEWHNLCYYLCWSCTKTFDFLKEQTKYLMTWWDFCASQICYAHVQSSKILLLQLTVSCLDLSSQMYTAGSAGLCGGSGAVSVLSCNSVVYIFGITGYE